MAVDDIRADLAKMFNLPDCDLIYNLDPGRSIHDSKIYQYASLTLVPKEKSETMVVSVYDSI